MEFVKIPAISQYEYCEFPNFPILQKRSYLQYQVKGPPKVRTVVIGVFDTLAQPVYLNQGVIIVLLVTVPLSLVYLVADPTVGLLIVSIFATQFC